MLARLSNIGIISGTHTILADWIHETSEQFSKVVTISFTFQSQYVLYITIGSISWHKVPIIPSSATTIPKISMAIGLQQWYYITYLVDGIVTKYLRDFITTYSESKS